MTSLQKRGFKAKMPKSHHKVIFFLCSVVVWTSGNALVHFYIVIGETVVLNPSYAAPFITNIGWNHGSDMAAEWFGGNVTCFGQFKGRCSLDFYTGALTITGADKSDSGLYSVEINDNKIDSNIQLSIIYKVSKPSILEECNTDLTSCNLTCDGDTKDAEPVSYKWFTGDNQIGSDKKLEITKETKEESFTCTMLNPVSNQSSDRLSNPIINKGERNRMITIIITVVIALAVCAVIIGRIVFFIRTRRHGVSYELREDGGMSEYGTPGENTEMLPNGGAGQDQVNAQNSAVPSTNHKPTNHVPTLIEEEAKVGGDGD